MLYGLLALAAATTGVAFALLGFNLVVLTFALLVYVYTVATRRPRRVSLTGLAATEATIVLVWLVRPQAIGSDASTLVLDGLILAAAWSLGDGPGGGRRRSPGAAWPRPPAPGLAEVEVLAAEVARAGVRVEVRIEGTPSELPAGLDLSALTNVIRHAGPATARVTVRHSSGQVAVEVVDDGGGAAKGMESAVGRRSDDSDRPGGSCPTWS